MEAARRFVIGLGLSAILVVPFSASLARWAFLTWTAIFMGSILSGWVLVAFVTGFSERPLGRVGLAPIAGSFTVVMLSPAFGVPGPVVLVLIGFLWIGLFAIGFASAFGVGPLSRNIEAAKRDG